MNCAIREAGIGPNFPWLFVVTVPVDARVQIDRRVGIDGAVIHRLQVGDHLVEPDFSRLQLDRGSLDVPQLDIFEPLRKLIAGADGTHPAQGLGGHSLTAALLRPEFRGQYT